MLYNAPEPSKLPSSHEHNPLFNFTAAPGWMDSFLGRYALPSQAGDFSALFINEASQFDDDVLRHEHHTIVTFDEAQLDTLEIRHRAQQELEPQHQTFIINFNCNFKVYEQSLIEMQDNARDLQTNVIGFNYRNVGRSQGQLQFMCHLIIDGIAQVQRLLDQGVSPENITLNGLSIGGGIATCVAWYFHQQGQKVNLFNDRSFASSLKLVLSHVESIPILGGVLGFLCALIIFNSAWYVSISELFQDIPEEFRDYMLVRTSRATRTAETLDDLAIPHESSLHLGLREERRQIKGDIDSQLRQWEDEELIDANTLNKLKKTKHEAKEKARNRKMEASVVNIGDDYAHTLPKKYLFNRCGVSADTFFKNFVQRSYEEHGIKPSACMKV
ncbi:hypothetical protein J2N86_13145 [Legionella lytica]|uniref:Substrate of the Dot/Icm system n=1 Tax=Legionella lytica TaxID=96232 RepID=A0ABY4Y840_9GAMM|nr:hypothetical protein [Legionella lytica]USQ13611.1 hypothetical protein J2N86_13145 [Legionella lytica]